MAKFLSPIQVLLHFPGLSPFSLLGKKTWNFLGGKNKTETFFFVFRWKVLLKDRGSSFVWSVSLSFPLILGPSRRIQPRQSNPYFKVERYGRLLKSNSE